MIIYYEIKIVRSLTLPILYFHLSDEETSFYKMKLKNEEDDTSDESFESDDEEISNDGESKPKYAVKDKWTNRERVLIFCSRGASYRDRHLMNDLKTLMPHSKGESKIDKKQKLIYINEICEMKNCNKCIYFETRKRRDLYMWLANIERLVFFYSIYYLNSTQLLFFRGPSAKFLVQNVHTTGELKLSGNCLKGSRPILSFDKTFDDHPHFQLLKELIAQTFSTPNFHPKSQPFIDHVLNFSVDDDRIWLRNYQIVDETTQKLEEIGKLYEVAVV